MVDPDKFRQFTTGKGSPAESANAIVPDDSNDLTVIPRAIYVGVTGDIHCTLLNDSSAVIFTAVPIGIWPFRVKRVYATGTSASGIIGLS